MESMAVGALWGCGLLFLGLKDCLHIEVLGALGICEASEVPMPCSRWRTTAAMATATTTIRQPRASFFQLRR